LSGSFALANKILERLAIELCSSNARGFDDVQNISAGYSQ